jgi:hypothetical protein
MKPAVARVALFNAAGAGFATERAPGPMHGLCTSCGHTFQLAPGQSVLRGTTAPRAVACSSP